MIEPLRFRAMGCDVVAAGATAPGAVAVRALFAHRDATFSRFRADSELCRVNGSRADAVAVSEPFARAVAAALDALAATGGLVDPTLLAAVEHAGYDRDFPGLRPDPRPPGPAAPGAGDRVRVAGRLVLRPPGLRLDLNGVVKAMAVDDALALLGAPAWVAAGGDLAASRPLDVALPGGGTVRLARGALATSGSSARRWRRGGAERHHLIDPRTGRPAVTRWSEVTVCGARCLD
ncbi:MAG TPA: FAD:protein FMN transferase, partial [Solirubrobacteraceae bacterium]|nr:FAD:protein FMN transferase [Solirubrobacteraceae bacterium]